MKRGVRRADTTESMRVIGNFLILISLASGPVSSARFSVDGVPSAPSATLATLQPRNGAPTYSWLRVYFYTSATATDRAKASNPRDLTRSNWSAILQLTVDKEGTVWQVDLSLPGHTCTIAASDVEARDHPPDVSVRWETHTSAEPRISRL
jgi:hypothetical protein